MAQRGQNGRRGRADALAAQLIRQPATWLVGAAALLALLAGGMLGAGARGSVLVDADSASAGALEAEAAGGASAAAGVPEDAGASAAEDGIDGASGAAAGDGSAPLIYVDVAGAVAAPAVVVLPEGARVQDAIDAAGGLAADADLAAVNRAAVVADGAKVVVPRIGEAVPAAASGEAGAGATGAAASPAAGSAASSGPVNINSASADELDALPGVGPATAAAIIEDRTQNGPFTAPEDLMRVSGIGEKKLARLEGLICV